jgi:uncharacterized membrane protein (DUF485 family)
MSDKADILVDPEFQRILTLRSRWRWGLSGLLIGAYLIWAVGGIYYSAAYAAPFMGIALPWGMAVGLVIIALSIVLSIAYVRIVNRLEAEEIVERDKHQ